MEYSHMRKQGIRGFTLIELLVVISVLAILLALIVPASTHMIWFAKKVSCASNLHQIHIGITAAAGDHGGQFIDCRFGESDGPNPGHAGVQKAFNPEEWPMLEDAGLAQNIGVGNYTSKVMACPDRDYEPQVEGTFQFVVGYQYFGGIDSWNTPSGKFPSRSPVNIGTAQGGWALTADPVGRIDGAWGAGRATAYKDMPPHRKSTPWPLGGNVGFVDGSVKWILFDDMMKIHSWSWGGARDYFFYQRDLGTYVPPASALGMNNKF